MSRGLQYDKSRSKSPSANLIAQHERHAHEEHNPVDVARSNLRLLSETFCRSF